MMQPARPKVASEAGSIRRIVRDAQRQVRIVAREGSLERRQKALDGVSPPPRREHQASHRPDKRA